VNRVFVGESNAQAVEQSNERAEDRPQPGPSSSGNQLAVNTREHRDPDLAPAIPDSPDLIEEQSTEP